jgi:DNA-binding MarR family transcriptional regulator
MDLTMTKYTNENGIPQFRPSIKDLEDSGLLISTRDDGDKRRKTIQITSKGWMVNHHLQSADGAAIETLPEEIGADE